MGEDIVTCDAQDSSENSTFITSTTAHEASLYDKLSYLLANTSTLAGDYVILPVGDSIPLPSLIFNYILPEYNPIIHNDQEVHNVLLYSTLLYSYDSANNITCLLSTVLYSLYIDTYSYNAFLDNSSTLSSISMLLPPVRL